MNFVEHIMDHLRSGAINNYPQPVSLNMGLAYTVKLEDRKTNLIWLPFEYTGLAYVDMGQQVNVYPYYRGVIFEEVELSRGTDLHKPQTEEAFVKTLFHKSWEMHQLLQQEKYAYLQGSAPDFLTKMLYIADWLRYYNSAVTVGARKS
ncbi:hypothetical protein ACFPES_28700 [Paenibacillus sp. GCM10023248]|uniref:hypothetical protein n=1 Tax=Bacillales TaxID=1385 RepID=UPI002377F470|nr:MULTISPECIES: hypothetical protein [Bacillales]MDD9271033.1 hypothetical protein [Paenibacillus sp. MAHUQ-63]MDR6882829.1 hypothetical protein [Bacillus sp. 3255]